ncbi:M6 family metalloprotease domain-containing protein [Shewanella sp. Scap07]|uniref:M6 family metalloprotease domain-containing protein n=1 Tax=Shewanella sp. Scap07 TaxID=2589987 RepID=UPI0015BF6211|nr:M6 family metalloprotease domain-containing protein [Shewanella sp. Scap07]QLE84957.1 M6 family metalloprotease domain-containing protein [Shewanella sp. Scap07]
MNNKLKLALLTSMVSTILALPSPHAISAPAATQLVEVTQPDGSRVWLRKWGDEFAHGWETAQGVPVVKDDASGYWYVAELDDAGRQTQSAQRLDLRQVLQPSAQHKLGGRNLKRDAQWHAQKRRKQAHQTNVFARASANGPSAQNSGVSQTAIMPITGTIDVPVVMVNFADTQTTATRDEFDHFLFQDSQGLTAYYQEVSYGHLNLAGGNSGVIDWVKLPNDHAFYGRNNSAGYDSNIGVMITQALDGVDQNVDFSQFADINQDCQVDLISIIYQGNGEHQAVGAANDIWAHKYSLYWLQSEGDGDGVYTTNDTCLADPSKRVTVNDYFVAPELSNAGQRANVGTFAHEFGHVFGLPDLYDTGGTNSGQTAGAGDWSLMASGSKTGPERDGESPAHLSAWGKYTLGWITPTRLNGMNQQQVTIGESVNHSQAYLYENPDNPQEYFLIENRQQRGFDAYSPGTGLAIWHIDDALAAPGSNGETQSDVNAYPCDLGYQDCSTLHNGVQLVSADHYFDLEHDFNDGDQHDLFGEDGDGGADEYSTDQDWDTEFSDRSLPNNHWWDDTESGLNITNISVKADQMSFDVATPSEQTDDEIVLTNGVEVVLSAQQNQQISGYIEVPAGASELSLLLTHLDGGDADLYVNFDTLNDTSTADCFLNTASRVELCSETQLGTTQAGRYYFVVKGYNGQAFSQVSLVASYSQDGEPPVDEGNESQFAVNVANGEYQHISVSVPEGTSRLTIALDENNGAAMLMANYGSQASARTYDVRDNNGELVEVNMPQSGNWYIAIRGRNNGVTAGTLTVTID